MMNPEPSGISNAASRPPQTANPGESPWWLKYLVRFVGTASSIAALALGVLACLTITPRCLLAGITQMLAGVFVALVEAPCLCMFLDFAQAPSAYFDRKPYWHRGIVFVIISILPISLCPAFSTFFGSGLIFLAGCLYGMLSLGKKASIDEMRVKASSSYNLLNSAKNPDIEMGPNSSATEPKKSGPI